MIMAAGLGTRMRPLTNDRPKPLVEVRGKALIDHAIDRLVAAGVTMIVVNVHYKADMLKTHLAKRKDVEIRISDETDELLGTGGGIVKALPHFEGEPFFVHNSELGLGRRHRPRARPHEGALGSGQHGRAAADGVDGDGDRLRGHRRFQHGCRRAISRACAEQRLSPFAYPGVQIVHPRLFDDAPGASFSMNRLWDMAIEQGRLYGIRLDGVWIHVGTPEAVREADEFLADLVLGLSATRTSSPSRRACLSPRRSRGD